MPEVEKAATCYVDTKVKEVVPSGVLCERNGEEMLVEADTVVCALALPRRMTKWMNWQIWWMSTILSETARR